MQPLLNVVNPALLMTFFSYVQSTFMQCYSVALSKRLISGSVHAGNVLHMLYILFSGVYLIHIQRSHTLTYREMP